MFNKIRIKFIKFIKNNYKDLIVGSIVLFLALYKLPYNIYTGGGIIDIKDKLTVENAYKETGSFNMAYVTSMRANIPIYLLSYVFDWERESIEDVKLDENDNSKDMWEREKLYLEEANNNAVVNAYKMANEYIKINKELLQILYVDKDSDTSLKIGDTIIEIDGKEIKKADDITDALSKFEIGDKVEVKYLRNDNHETGYIVVRELDGEKKAGIYIIKLYEYDVNRKVDIKFDSSEGGPSGGFMLSLAIYNRLVPEDLTKGRKIAGTGTIEDDGTVGEIGGVKYKVIGANSGDADVFFVPEDNYQEAIDYKNKKGYDLNIVKVKTLSDAIDYLRRN